MSRIAATRASRQSEDGAEDWMDLADWRKKIDAIDRDLVRLLNERARCVAEIARIKRDRSLPIQEVSREREVFDNALAMNQGPLEDGELRRVFERIVEEGKNLQRRLMQKESEPRQ
jgi:chorismate mutase